METLLAVENVGLRIAALLGSSSPPLSPPAVSNFGIPGSAGTGARPDRLCCSPLLLSLGGVRRYAGVVERLDSALDVSEL